MTTVFGIESCDTVKRARQWFEKNELEYSFHDFRDDGITEEQLSEWVKELGWETLLNRRSTTWRNLPDKQKINLDETKAISIMKKQPTIIKRPVIEHDGRVHAGFSEAYFKHLFKI